MVTHYFNLTNYYSKEPQNVRNATNLPTPKKIEFTVNKEINDLVKKSEKNFDQFVHGYGHRILNWNNYGSGFIKVTDVTYKSK